MWKFYILGAIFLIGMNAIVNFFIKESWRYKNKLNSLIYYILLAIVDFGGLSLMIKYLLPSGWPACLQGMGFWWC